MRLEEGFIERLRRREAAACEALFHQFHGPLFRFLYCHTRDHHLAQELTGEAILQLLRSLPRYRGGQDSLKGFVFAIAHHVLRRHWRRRRPVESWPVEAEPVAPIEERLYLQDEQIAHVLQAISHFEAPMRSVLLLKYVEDCSIGTISRALEMPENTVKSNLHRGRRLLRELFAEKAP